MLVHLKPAFMSANNISRLETPRLEGSFALGTDKESWSSQ